ncbi:Maf family protein [Palleronia caenipelagi]|uniref:Nucleoside triphosphate pyrophosphatase n=1 Tax=Palleronia caenipelagi TaxID=2489174 RepID=A0A547Q8R7_9RHOB|nr:Maf family protein [Palleronia caenipelagi]TRD22787.1 septum formation protein Maf [Palleronia caenipelagi]
MILLASSSETRRQLLRNAGIEVTSESPRVDEDAIKDALVADGVKPRDIADALAEAKARKVALRHPEAFVLGCDQVLALDDKILSKPRDQSEACDQLLHLSGRSHRLLSASVVYEDARPVWRHVGEVRLEMRPLSTAYVEEYVARNWDTIRHSVGGYRLEEEGARLFTRIEGDYFTVLGLPLLPLLSWLIDRGYLDS